MQGTYWLTVLPETSQLRPRIKRALRGIDDEARVNPTVDDRQAESSGRRFGGKFRRGFDASGAATPKVDDRQAERAGSSFGAKFRKGFEASASNLGATARLIGAGFTGASDATRSMVRNVGTAATVLGVATKATKGLAFWLGGAATGLKVVAGASLAKVAGMLGFTARMAGQLASNVTRVTSAILLLATVGKVLGFMSRAAKWMALLTVGSAALIGVVSALASQLGGALVAALTVVGSAAGVAAGALVGILGPAIATAKLAFKGLGEGAKAFQESMKDVWGPADEAFSKMIGQRMGPLLTQFRELKMAVTDAFSGALTPAMNSAAGVMQKMQPAMTAMATTLGRIGSEVAGAIASPANMSALDKMFAASNQFIGSLSPGLQSLVSGLVQFASTAADTFKGVGAGISEQLTKFGDWLRGISPAQMILAFQALKLMVTNVWNVLKPVIQGIRDIGAVSAPALAPGFQAIGQAIGQAVPGLVQMSQVLMPALSQVMERLAPVLPALVQAFTPWAGVLAAVAPPLASIVAQMAPLAPLVMLAVGAVKLFGAGMIVANTAAAAYSIGLGVFAAATGRSAASLGANVIALGAHRAALIAGTVASRAFGVALAFATGPVGLVVAAVVAAGAAIWAFFAKTETGRKLWAQIWPAITNAVKVAWDWIKTTLSTAWQQIGPSLMKIGDIAKQAFGKFVEAAKSIWTAIQPAIAWIGRLWLSVQKFQFTVAIAALKALGAAIGWLWTNVVVPAFNGIAAAVSTWWSAVQVVWGAATTAIGWVGDKVMWLWHNVAEPAFSAIGSVVSTWWSGVQAVWDLFTTALDKVSTGVGALKDGFVTAFNAIKDVVLGVWDKIKGVIDSIGNGIGAVVDKLRGAPIIGNLIPGHADGRAPGFASGRPASLSRSGRLSGPGTGTSDSILAMLSNGEGVVKESAMRGGGATVVAALNSGWVPSAEFLRGMLPGFAEGRGPDISVAEQLVGTKYSQAQRFDCSGVVARIINGALGMGGGLMSTKNARQWLSERGFVDGSGGPGQIRVGWYDHGPNPNDGHMAMTLSDGRNAESGGRNGVFTIGAGAAGADDPQFDNHMYLPQLFGEGAATGGAVSSLGRAVSAGGGGSYRAATSSELSTSAGRVESANSAVTQANQAVDDRTYARDKAQRRLDDLKAQGKDTADAQHSLDVANRELKDATDKQAKAKDKAAKAEQDDADLRSQGVQDAQAAGDKKSSNGFGDLGKAFAGGIFETIGLDGSFLSNPFEWPTIKSAMAGVNWLGKALMGDESGSAGGGAASDLGGGLVSAFADSAGLDVANLNPAAADISAAPASAVAPDTTQHGAGAGAAPGPAVVIENAGMDPTALSNKLSAEFNARTRTTKVH
ncbi:hypothetical protein ACJH6J_24695 [Mycobacterium sp. SMC-18]|uniref:hypothetical protein n=1 Tax=Mycobacterium sp. SMC-18 TaxID=3381629 RepID=UPI0038777CFB